MEGEQNNNSSYLSDIGSKIYTSWSGLRTPSTSSLTYAPLSSVTSYKDQWNAWYEWQKTQPAVHFQRSDVFKKYASKNNVPFDLIFKPEVTYVLGDFKYFVPFNFIKNEEIFWEHVKILLDLYDCCKGIRRNVFGDSNYIILLKRSFHEKNISQLLKYDYNECNYNLEKLHCHTIAYFSLSTLVMRFVSHLIFLQYGETVTRYPRINNIMFDNMYHKDCYSYGSLLTNGDSLYETIPHLHDNSHNYSTIMVRSSPLAIPGRQVFNRNSPSSGEYSSPLSSSSNFGTISKKFGLGHGPQSDPRSSINILSSSLNTCPGCNKITNCNKNNHCQECYNKKIEMVEFYNKCDNPGL